MATAAVNGITIGYDDEGAGPALVLVHGHPFDRSMWAPQTAAFAGDGWRVVAPDLRGYGQSSVVAGTTGFETFAADLAALLDHLGIDGAVLVGLSMGGQLVLECYRRFAPRVRGLVLADTFAHPDPDGGAARRAMAERLLAEGMGGYAAEVLGLMLAPANVTGLPAVAAHVHAMMAGTAPAGAAAALRGRAAREDYRPLLAGIRVPTLVVVGRDDGYTPVADAEAMCRAIPGARLAVVEGAGHLPNLERPAAFNAALRDFLTETGLATTGLATTGLTQPGLADTAQDRPTVR